jgi:3-oxoacyl-[acyl-carrier protein] reductase
VSGVVDGHPVGLVTGGARGIGLAIARAWAARGVAVAVVDREPDAALRIAAALPAGAPQVYLQADVRDFACAQEIVDEVVRRFGRLDYVALNAGITRDRTSWKMGEEEWDDVIGVNLKGAFNYARAAAPVLRERGAGRIVFVSSINALRGKFGQSNYAASKAGLIGLARSLALELGSRGITVNVVAPGFIHTDMTAGLPPEAEARARAETPLGRAGEPEDVAAAVDFLCREESRHITGVVLRVDGGQALHAEGA